MEKPRKRPRYPIVVGIWGDYYLAVPREGGTPVLIALQTRDYAEARLRMPKVLADWEAKECVTSPIVEPRKDLRWSLSRITVQQVCAETVEPTVDEPKAISAARRTVWRMIFDTFPLLCKLAVVQITQASVTTMCESLEQASRYKRTHAELMIDFFLHTINTYVENHPVEFRGYAPPRHNHLTGRPFQFPSTSWDDLVRASR